jgi:hypothetical protein
LAVGALRFAVALSVLWFSSAPVRAQKLEDLNPDPTGTAALTGARPARVRLMVSEPPSADDVIVVSSTIGKVHVTLITPGGRRITAANAAATGFKWEREDNSHSTGGLRNPGSYTTLTFARNGRAGPYTVEVTAAAVQAKGQIIAWFRRITPTMDSYLEVLRQLPGAQITDSVPISLSTRLRFELRRDEPLAVFDAVVTDSSVELQVALPDGKILSREQTGKDEVNWSTVECSGMPKPEPDDAFSSFITMVSMMPVKGCHHVIQFPNAARGTYELRVVKAGRTAGRLRAAFVPVRAELEPSTPPLPGQVRIRRGHPAYQAFAGDEMT